MLNDRERRAVLRLARETIAAKLAGVAGQPDAGDVPAVRAGAFVTLEVGGELRGCIGQPRSSRWLADVVAECAVSAAFEDPRFAPLRASELDRVSIEVSVLGPILPVDDPQDIEVGRDGLIVSHGFAKGLLLPQVASERHWSRETFLSQTCLKAGLAADAWRRGARIERFEAEVFSEQSLGGAPGGA